MKRTAKAFQWANGKFYPMFDGLDITCNVVGEMATGEKRWCIVGNENGCQFSFHKKRGFADSYFMLESVD